jgi:uncharacterized RmlC-like cupin family protein
MKQECKTLRPTETTMRQYGLAYTNGICAESVGSQNLSLHLVVIPPGAVAKAHLHEHETAIYVLEGEVEMSYGAHLENKMVNRAGDFIYIPAGVPHKPRNTSQTVTARAVIARTDPNDEESAIMRPDLDDLPPS